MRLADYVMNFLADKGLDTAFLVTGGFAMHLNDALAGEMRLRKICCHNEQGAAYAAEGYGHVTGRPALLQLTAGPGSINALSGVFGAYTDSIPLVVISGQGKREVLKSTYGLEGVRLICDQEAEVVAMARSVTKYVRSVTSPERIAFELGKALHLAVSGRPGPVWLEIPLDVQAAEIDPGNLVHFRQALIPPPEVGAAAENILTALTAAKRPLLVVGPDLPPRLRPLFHQMAQSLGCPVVGAGAQDIMVNDHPLYAGRLGVVGTRAGNMAVQNADVIVFLAMRPYLGLVTYAWDKLGVGARKIVIDEDQFEFEKPCCIADEAIVCPPEFIMAQLQAQAQGFDHQRLEGWREHCRQAVNELDALPAHLCRVTSEGAVNPYWLAETLGHLLRADDIIVAGNASSSIIPLQATPFKSTQRMFSNHGNGPMGFALPAAIGAALAAKPGQRVVCLEGDGSLMMNIQEMQTAAHHKLPLTLLVLNNGGYVSIKQSQSSLAHRVGYDAATGVSFPDFGQLARTFGFQTAVVEGPDFAASLEKALQLEGPALIDVRLDPEQGFEPKVASQRQTDGRMVSSPPQEMSPLLPGEIMAKYFLGSGGQK